MKKMIAKVVPIGNDEVAVEFNQKDLDTLGWKCGDSFKWKETEDGIFLSKECPKEEVLIKPELDDRAFAVGDFIQQLGEVQDQKFEALWQECKEKEWIKGMDEETAKDWLFDYVFNGWEKDSLGFDKCFSEYCGGDWE